MEKILNLRGLGTGGRQNELIELALTYRFDAVEIDMADLLGRFDAMGKQFALQFLLSARTRVGTFRLPIDFGAEEAKYQKDVAKLPTIIELAQALSCPRCYLEIEAGCESQNFQENFEKHRTRLHDVGQRLQEAGMRLGLGLQHSAARNTKAVKFIRTPDELLTLVRMVGQPNVGMFVDTWNWQVCGGSLAQLEQFDAKMLTEVRLADLADGVDPAKAQPSQIQLPGSSPEAFSVKVLQLLSKTNYVGGISVQTHASLFAHQSRDAVVHAMAKRLDQLLAIAAGTLDVESLRKPEPDAVAEELSTTGA